VYLQHTAENDSDDGLLINIKSELDRLLSITERYNTTACDFPPLADNHFRPGAYRMCFVYHL